ncbi:MAG: type II secretion system F family protein, partial [Sulfolobales archaeon]
KLTSALIVYFDAIALTLFERVSPTIAKTFELDKSLKIAGLYIHPKVYACRVLLITLLSGIISLIVVGILVMVLQFALLVKLLLLLTPVISCIIAFAIGLIYPSLSAFFRKLYVESELPFFSVYVTTMVKGGLTVEKCLERVSRLKLFKYMRREASEILRLVKMFGADPLSAIEKVAYDHPSTKFRDLMLGYVTTLRSGGDVSHYLEVKTKELLDSRSADVKAVIERLTAFMELYIILGVVVLITVFTFYAAGGAMSITGGPRFSSIADLSMPILYVNIVLPALSAIILILVHVTLPKTELPIRSPYYTLLISIPFAVLAMASVIVIGGSLHIFKGVLRPWDVVVLVISLGVGLLTVSIPPSLVYTLESRGTRGVSKSLAEFLRDLSEVRKTGLSPEKCIVTLSQRSYGNLTTIVKRAATAISMGITLDKALARSMRRLRDWFIAIVFRFLVDSVLYGGGSPEIIEALAIFAQGLSDSEIELRRSLRAYVLLPYFGIIMISSAPLIIVWQLTMSAGLRTQPEMLTGIIATLSIGALINSYITGIVAGKLSRMVLAAGFTHSIIAVLLTLTVLMITMSMIGFI